MHVDIQYQSALWEQALKEEVIEKIFEACGKIMSVPASVEVSVVLADNDFIHDLNRQYRDKDAPTDVLSFPQQDLEEGAGAYMEGMPLGDIILAYEKVENDATSQGKIMMDHVHHMLVHGFLHLLGYDHLDVPEAERMEKKEVEILRALGVANPYET